MGAGKRGERGFSSLVLDMLILRHLLEVVEMY